MDPSTIRPDLATAEGFARAYASHRAAVYGAAWRVLQSRELAEDVTQDVFLWLWRHPQRYDRRRSLTAFLGVVARNRAIDAWRSVAAERRACDRSLVSAALAGDGLADNDPASVVERDERARELRLAVAAAPARHRDVLVLSYWGEMTRHELAGHLGIPIGTAKARVRRALALLARTVPCA
jgi:RNA polymerase sigma-70 factor (ECF subfamily)